jgi:MerR family copper efflux transcriptional regulator
MEKQAEMALMTIGELATRAGVRTSTLRYYEDQGLLFPVGRTAAGYRLYEPAAERTLAFVQRARRLGFSLADIRVLLAGDPTGSGSVVELAEKRFQSIESRLTELLVMRHELEHLLREFRSGAATPDAQSVIDRLLGRICAEPTGAGPADSIFAWLTEQTACRLGTVDVNGFLDTLRGRHVHIWREGDSYYILVVSHDPAVVAALGQLTQLEAGCQVHSTPRFHHHQEGTLLVAQGEHAYILARLFLSLENESPYKP